MVLQIEQLSLGYCMTDIIFFCVGVVNWFQFWHHNFYRRPIFDYAPSRLQLLWSQFWWFLISVFFFFLQLTIENISNCKMHLHKWVNISYLTVKQSREIVLSHYPFTKLIFVMLFCLCFRSRNCKSQPYSKSLENRSQAHASRNFLYDDNYYTARFPSGQKNGFLTWKNSQGFFLAFPNNKRTLMKWILFHVCLSEGVWGTAAKSE